MAVVLVTKRELKQTYGIAWSWATLNHYMDVGYFPPTMRLSPGMVVWKQSDIEKFLEALPDGRSKKLRNLWPPRPPRSVPPGKKKRGRKPGSRLVQIDGKRRVVRPEELAAAE